MTMRLSLLQLAECRQYFFTVARRFNTGPDFNDFALWINQEGVARGNPLIAQRAVFGHDFLVGVRQKLERQALFRTKILVAFASSPRSRRQSPRSFPAYFERSR